MLRINDISKYAGLLLLIIFLNNQPVIAQVTGRLSLERAYTLATQNYPLIKQKDLIKQTADININNLSKAFLPQLSVGGQATYQSDVTSIKIPVPGISIEPLSKDQYKIQAEATQLIYDGGIIQDQKRIQQLNETVEQQKTEVELYKVKEKINQLFLGVLYLDEQLKQVDLIKADLQIGIKRTEAQVNNGVAFRSNLNLLKAELLKADQRAIEIKASRKGFIETLALFLNQPLDETLQLDKPELNAFAVSTELQRPELKLFSDQTKLFTGQESLIKAKNLPKVNAFVQAGYGRPGLNLLLNDFATYYIGGVRFNWAFGGLYTSKKEKQLLQVNKRMVDVQKDLFMLNTNTQLKQQQSEIDKQQQLITTDNEIIDLRTQVKEAAKAQLENGVITANDYLREVNAEDQARQALIGHRIQLLQAQINYQTISGKQ